MADPLETPNNCSTVVAMSCSMWHILQLCHYGCRQAVVSPFSVLSSLSSTRRWHSRRKRACLRPVGVPGPLVTPFGNVFLGGYAFRGRKCVPLYFWEVPGIYIFPSASAGIGCSWKKKVTVYFFLPIHEQKLQDTIYWVTPSTARQCKYLGDVCWLLVEL